jgi:two-component system sensor histidine kinase KdpD
MALRQAAHEVDLRTPDEPASPRSEVSGDHERILIPVTDAPGSVGLIRRGRRVADYLRADCFAVAVVTGPGLTGLPAAQREALERHLDFARKLHIDTRVLDADDPAEALAGFAHTNGITQIFLSKPRAPRTPLFAPRKLLAMRVIRAARDIQVTVVADRER